MTFFSPSTTNFSLDFEYRNDVDCYNIPQNVSKNQLTLGWILGFRGNYVKQKFGSKTFTLNKAKIATKKAGPKTHGRGKSK